ncbi:MAG: NADH-quinone oxidoreductase subunit C [Acidiphilium sp. 21-60-14]|nr:MAG: NADH-quinone oxidoreductase subunit C [Acidiphilium sp. 21-60-14]OYV90975.1 MAG: NADH-quinone oxidoreductase subunit C [Acidiphilium sp. 37-60-79]OZB38902.1 MAG: NADH-quinone oxidoreductase subunit C [Acidiphilium sp. 34-60-192]
MPVAEAEDAPVVEAAPIDAFAASLAILPGVGSVFWQGAERVALVERAALASVMMVLRDDPRFAFQQCMDVCGVDWPQRGERFDVVYQLLSLTRNDRLRVITTTDETQPVPSVSGIWPGTAWWEREVWDLFGVQFDGLADHRRIMTDYGFEGHPLRKDFPLTGHVELRYDADEQRVVYDHVVLAQEFRHFDFLSPWEAMTTLPGDEKAIVAVAGERAGKP